MKNKCFNPSSRFTISFRADSSIVEEEPLLEKSKIKIISPFYQDVCKRDKKSVFNFLLLPIIFTLCSVSIISCEKIVTLNPVPINIWDSLSKQIVHFDSSAVISSKCISSYAQLVSELNANPQNVTAVEFFDGTRIYTGNYILGMTYTAYDSSENYSLFRSRFDVTYNLYGYQQENSINCWSLGCTYATTGVAPFTNILKGNQVLLINTSFIWNLPDGSGKLIKYIIIP